MLLWTSEAIRVTPALCLDVKAFKHDVTLGVVVDGSPLLEDIHIEDDAATAALIDALQTALRIKREANRH
ncbi:hypothetical protein [Frateuria terrea]|uniref:Uncharacterized protein n=1 Tax=Frateuria terrea TaxID=529704 RepID=A0A1H6ZNN3_9GAMM|nr:hypothetical protein [Frateuria terrea]SEJ55029.1 hypothetical protein SAMN04487997_0181 [Frateuria terrea]SFP47473.1 hypothetical protein SAMN02927913_2209 [Frateuria terrea]